jgi:hypothetical protein
VLVSEWPWREDIKRSCSGSTGEYCPVTVVNGRYHSSTPKSRAWTLNQCYGDLWPLVSQESRNLCPSTARTNSKNKPAGGINEVLCNQNSCTIHVD